MQYIIFSTAYGDSEDEIADDLVCTQQNINYYRFKIINDIKRFQI